MSEVMTTTDLIPCCNPKCSRTFTREEVGESVTADYLRQIIAGSPISCETVLADEDGDGACIGEKRYITHYDDDSAWQSEKGLRLAEGWEA